MKQKEDAKVIKEMYDSHPEAEWARTDQTVEYCVTTRMLEKLIGRGDKVLDIGGGPGRYSLWLAERGCEVTLFDLSDGNIAFAREKAAERGLPLKTICGNAVEAANYPEEKFDHVLVMGPMYHLFQESDRRKVIENAMKVLKPDGKIYIAFINLLAGVLYYLDECPENFKAELDSDNEYGECLLENQSWQGLAFTEARFDSLPDICRFTDSLGLERVTMFGQEGILGANLKEIEGLEEPHRSLWIDYAYRLCEREEYLAMSDHIMYVGRPMKENWNNLFDAACKGASSKSKTMDGSVALEKYFDEEGKLVAEYCPNEKGLLQNRKIYQYQYDTQHRVTQVTQYHEGICLAKDEYIYDNLHLEKSLHYYNREGNPSGTLALSTMHQYIYQEGQLTGDEVFLASGERCCFRRFSADMKNIIYPHIPGFSWEWNHIKGEIINPFRTDFSWVLRGADEDCLCITITEKRFTPQLFSDMILHLHQAYEKRPWIIIDCYRCSETSEEENEEVGRLLREYEKDLGMQIDFG